MVVPSSSTNSRVKKKKKKATPPPKVPDFLQTVGSLYPVECRTKDRKLPRKYKGTYCCQLFARVKLGQHVSKKLRTRTVSVGFRAATSGEKREAFQEKVDEAVHHLSRERVLASLFANFVFLERLREGSALPEPDRSFFKSCLSSCIISRGGGSLNEDFDRFSSLTGLKRHDPPKELNLDQQREHEAGCMATSTSTRAEHHTEKRRTSITKWFLRGRIPRGELENKKYASSLYNLAKAIITEFDGTHEGEQNVQERALAIDPAAEADSIITFARREKEFSDRVCGDKTSALRIKHLNWMFNTYVAESRWRYDEALSRAHAFSPGEDKESSKKRYVFMGSELGEDNAHPPPKDAAVLPICSTRSVFIHIATLT
ncbi:unnamed protein product [Pylaiella littoralis]